MGTEKQWAVSFRLWGRFGGYINSTYLNSVHYTQTLHPVAGKQSYELCSGLQSQLHYTTKHRHQHCAITNPHKHTQKDTPQPSLKGHRHSFGANGHIVNIQFGKLAEVHWTDRANTCRGQTQTQKGLGYFELAPINLMKQWQIKK